MTHENIVQQSFKSEIERFFDKGKEECRNGECDEMRIAVLEMLGNGSNTKVRLQSA